MFYKFTTFDIVMILILFSIFIFSIFSCINESKGADFQNLSRQEQNKLLKEAQERDRKIAPLNKFNRTYKPVYGQVVGLGQGSVIMNPFWDSVGYAPIIITLPEGANFGVSAIVSADRRYVRITPTFSFSQITGWRTFTFQGPNSGRTTVYNNKK